MDYKVSGDVLYSEWVMDYIVSGDGLYMLA